MENRRYSSDIMYPFVPGDRAIMDYKAGLVDCLFVIDRGYPAGPAQPVPARPRVELYGLNVAPAGNTYRFRYVYTNGSSGLLEFLVPASSGFVRASDGHSVIVVNSDIMYSALSGDIPLPCVPEVEPGRIIWRLDEVLSVALVNEERRHNPADRHGLANSTLALFSTDGDTVSLVDGYNCALSYDEATGTLTINAGQGLGKGLPKTIPWDDAAPDIDSGIKTINGIGYMPDIGIEPGASVVLGRGDAEITLTVLRDREA